MMHEYKNHKSYNYVLESQHKLIALSIKVIFFLLKSSAILCKLNICCNNVKGGYISVWAFIYRYVFFHQQIKKHRNVN